MIAVELALFFALAFAAGVFFAFVAFMLGRESVNHAGLPLRDKRR